MGIIDNIERLKYIFSLAEKVEPNASDDVEALYKNRNVLVGVVRSKHQFYKLIKYKFYHIPIAELKNCEMPVKYVAIYQSKKLFKNKSGIVFFGEVAECKTVPRHKIREIKKNSDEPYLYLKIKRWHRLSNKIRANEMENVAFSTTMFLLKNSKDASELHIRSKREFEFYQKLVKIVKNLVKNRIPDHEDIIFGEYTIKFSRGLLCLYFGDVVEYVIGYDVFLEKPMDTVRDIFDYYPEI